MALKQRDDMKAIWSKIIRGIPLQDREKESYWRAYHQEYSRRYRKQHANAVRNYQRDYAKQHPQKTHIKNQTYATEHARQRKQYHASYYRTARYRHKSHLRYQRKMAMNRNYWRKVNARNAARYRKRQKRKRT